MLSLFQENSCKKKKKKKNVPDPCQNMGKISKVIPQSPHSIPWEREGSLTAKSLSPLAKTKNGLTVHSWVPLSSKFMAKIFLFKSSFFFSEITVNHADSAHFAHSPRELRKIYYKIHPH